MKFKNYLRNTRIFINVTYILLIFATYIFLIKPLPYLTSSFQEPEFLNFFISFFAILFVIMIISTTFNFICQKKFYSLVSKKPQEKELLEYLVSTYENEKFYEFPIVSNVKLITGTAKNYGQNYHNEIKTRIVKAKTKRNNKNLLVSVPIIIFGTSIGLSLSDCFSYAKISMVLLSVAFIAVFYFLLLKMTNKLNIYYDELKLEKLWFTILIFLQT